MSKLALNPEYGLYEKSGRPFCSTRQVAETFNKEHRNVIRDIETKILGVTAPDFTELNFELSAYKDESGKRNKEYLMTKDGFALLAMGFTGKKAMEFKVAYIARFNQMEAFIKSGMALRFDFPAFTDAVMNAHDEPKFYHYSNELNLINKLVIGVTAKQFKEAYGLSDVSSIRPYLSTGEIQAIEMLQRVDIGLLAAGLTFEQRKATLGEYLGRALAALAGRSAQEADRKKLNG